MEGILGIRREGSWKKIGIKLSCEVCRGRMGMWRLMGIPQWRNKLGSYVDQEDSQSCQYKTPPRRHGKAQLDGGGHIVFLTGIDYVKKPSTWRHFSPLLSSYKPIVEFIDAQFEAYLQEELKIRRVLHTYHDSRIHVCLYFIAPTGHSLKSLDLVTMKKLDSKVWGRSWGWASWTLTDLIYKGCWIPAEVLWRPNPTLCSLPP